MPASPQTGCLLKTGLWNAKVLLSKTRQAAQDAKMICCDPAPLEVSQCSLPICMNIALSDIFPVNAVSFNLLQE